MLLSWAFPKQAIYKFPQATHPVLKESKQQDHPDWPTLATRLAGRIPVERLEGHVRLQLKRAENAPEEPIAVACSGGADSLCLLLLLWAHFHTLRKRFTVLHFDHRIRGEESAADARFVREIAAVLNLPFKTASWEQSTPNATEEEARAARMHFLHETGIRIIAFGHNRSDVAENLLMRLGRGSSLDGLSGPRPVQKLNSAGRSFIHLRPLLGLSGEEIRTTLHECNICWREDATNAGSDYTRNRIRHEILPRLSEITGRDWEAGAARSRARIDEADRMIQAEAGHLSSQATLSTRPDDDRLNLTFLRSERSAIARRTIEIWFARVGLRDKVGPDIVDEIVAHVQSPDGFHRKMLGYRALGFEIEKDVLSGCKPQACPPVTYWHKRTLTIYPGCTVFFPDGSSLTSEPLRLASEDVEKSIRELRQNRDNMTACLAIAHDTPLTVRTREAHDRYLPLGAPGRITIAHAMKNRKIPLPERNMLPIVLVEGRVAWCPKIPPAEKFRLHAATNEAVRLTYRNKSTASDSDSQNAQ